MILSEEEAPVTFNSQGIVRRTQTTEQAGYLGNIPLSKTSFGEVEGLPEYKEGVYYIVSRMIRDALPDRQDLLVPEGIVRDEIGNIIGCKALAIN